MFIHKLLRGAGAELYLPFGLARLRALERIKGPKAYWTQKYSVPGFEIEVQQSPPFQYLRILATGGIRYEWFTSLHVDDTLSTPGHPGYVGGEATRALFTTVGSKTKPLYSTTLVPAADDPWLLRSTEAVNSADSGQITWYSWQHQKFFEHVWHSGTSSIVTSTQAQLPGVSNQCNWNSPYFGVWFSYNGAAVADTGLDAPPVQYTSAGLTVGAPELESQWLFWRRAAVHTAGGRQFFVMADNYGRFHVYPVKTRTPSYPEYLAHAGEYKTYTPPYPAWVTVPDIGNSLQTVNNWQWRFNSDATKCVSIPFHAEPNTDFKKYISQSAPSPYATMLHPESTATIDPAYLLTAHDDTPGLVEFGIAIEITGPGEMDYEATFTLLRTEYFTDNYRFFFDAAYFLADVEKIGIAADTLMTAEIQCKVPAGLYEAEMFIPSTATVRAVDGVRNMQSHCVLNSNDADMVPTERLRFHAWTPLSMMYPNGTFIRTYGYPTVAVAPVITPPGYTYLGNSIPTTSGPVTYFPVGPLVYSDAVDPTTGPGIIEQRTGYLWALELSTLSVLYSSSDYYGTQEKYMRGMSFGVEFYRYDFPPLTARSSPPLLDPVETVPSARPYQTVLNALLAVESGQGFNVHPDGHWSLAIAGLLGNSVNLAANSSDLDWISVVTSRHEDGTPVRARYRHKELYNTAFGQTRDYTYYVPGADPSLIDRGGFRTFGIWVSFR